MAKLTLTIEGAELGPVTVERPNMNEAMVQATIGWAYEYYHDEETHGPADPTDMAQVRAVARAALIGTALGMENSVRKWVADKAAADAKAAAEAAQAAMSVGDPV